MVWLWRVRRPVVALALVLSACASGPTEPPADFPFAMASPECGPADGPAVTISLTRDTMPELPPGSPQVRIYLWHALDELRGRRWDIGDTSPDGVADYRDGTGASTTLHGTVSILTVRPDSTVEGEVDLASGGAFSVRGGFRARWVPRTLICG